MEPQPQQGPLLQRRPFHLPRRCYPPNSPTFLALPLIPILSLAINRNRRHLFLFLRCDSRCFFLLLHSFPPRHHLASRISFVLGGMVMDPGHPCCGLRLPEGLPPRRLRPPQRFLDPDRRRFPGQASHPSLPPPTPRPRRPKADLFRRHSDYHASLADRGITLDFVWAPFEPNVTTLLRGLRSRSPAARPDVIVLGSGLWHMLHFTNSSLFGESLIWLKRAAVALLSTAPLHPPHMFWLGLPMLVNSMLNTEEKRVRMNETVWDEHDQELRPCLHVDIGSLSQGCGRRCTTDGMHYDNVVYEAALHVMLNALLIESQQRI